jgi:hypothetical protein
MEMMDSRGAGDALSIYLMYEGLGGVACGWVAELWGRFRNVIGRVRQLDRG